jgi:protein disulfide isomerase family A protein 3
LRAQTRFAWACLARELTNRPRRACSAAAAADAQWDYRFAFTTAEEILAKYKYKSAVVAFKPPRFTSEKVEKTKARYPGASLANSDALKIFLREKTLPLVGKFTYKTKERYTGRGLPVVKVFFDVDYELNPKGSNYYVNRVRKVAEEFADKLSFSIASLQDYSYDTADYGLSVEAGKKQVGVGIDDGRKRFGMVGKDFSVDNLKAFCQSFLAGELTPNKVVEDYTPPPPSPGGDEDEEGGEVDESAVAVAEPSNFDQIVDPAKNVLIEFYAPWCGHCKQLKPVYAKLAKEFADDDDVVIAKMDADAHKVPKPFDVQGFPTIFFKPKGGAPVTYDGARSAEAMAAFVRENKK